MKTKFQIFISSTYEDLKDERNEVIKAVLEMGQIPVGMEMFSAGDEQQWELIKRTIDDCDYYVVVVAHRYGSIDAGVSYTEKEYDYASSKGIPTLGFILEDKAKWSRSLMDTDPSAVEKLKVFKEKVKRKIVGFWSTAEDLHGKVSIALSKAMTAYPRSGWVRATEGTGADVTAELTRLSRENADMRVRIETLNQKKEHDNAFEITQIITLLQNNKTKTIFFFEDASDWSDYFETTLFKVFELIAPDLISEATTLHLALKLGTLLPKPGKRKRAVRDTWPIPQNRLMTWLADLHALDLVTPSTKKHHLNDDNEYWSITEKGRQLFVMMRVKELTENATRAEPISSS